MGILGTIRLFFTRDKYQDHIDRLKKKQSDLDARINRLERKATLNGEEGWFVDYVKSNPPCSLKGMRECNRDEGA